MVCKTATLRETSRQFPCSSSPFVKSNPVQNHTGFPKQTHNNKKTRSVTYVMINTIISLLPHNVSLQIHVHCFGSLINILMRVVLCANPVCEPLLAPSISMLSIP